MNFPNKSLIFILLLLEMNFVVNPYDEPDLQLSIVYSMDLKVNTPTNWTIKIINEGNGVANNITLSFSWELMDIHALNITLVEWEIPESGKLLPGNNITLVYEITPLQTGPFKISIELRYEDTLGNSRIVSTESNLPQFDVNPEVKPKPSFWDEIPGLPSESIILGLIAVIIILWRARKS